MSESEKPPRCPTARRHWYAEGLRFTCVRECGACCTRHGDCDYVYLEPEDVDALASHFGLDREAYLAGHTAEDDGLVILRMPEPDCPYLSGTACSVYDARPAQCRTFPFWRENLRSRVSWERLRSFCPGIDEGEVHDVATIRAIAATKPDR